MRGVAIVSLLGAAAMLSACGGTTERRAASGGLGGAVAGAAVAGPVGAVVGGGAGAATGAVLDEDVDQKVAEALPSGTSEQGGQRMSEASDQQVLQAQRVLKAQGYYRGQVDGIVGPRTREAVAAYQRREGLPQTAQLDRPTVDALMQEQAAAPAESQSPTGSRSGQTR